MRKPAAILLLSLAACSEQVEEAYPTWAEAERAGAVERGWIPAFVPSSARDIRESHDLDSNRQILQFTARPSDVPEMVEGLRPVSIENEGGAAELSRAHGFSAVSEAYIVCTNPLNGALVIDRESGRALYTTAVKWADDECS
jgi:hypothetical protein